MTIINNNPGSIFDVKLHSDKNNIYIYDVYFKSDVPCVPSKITVEFKNITRENATITEV